MAEQNDLRASASTDLKQLARYERKLLEILASLPEDESPQALYTGYAVNLAGQVHDGVGMGALLVTDRRSFQPDVDRPDSSAACELAHSDVERTEFKRATSGRASMHRAVIHGQNDQSVSLPVLTEEMANLIFETVERYRP